MPFKGFSSVIMCTSYRQSQPAQTEKEKEGISVFPLSPLCLPLLCSPGCSQRGLHCHQLRSWEEEEEEGVSPSATEPGRHMALLWSHFKWKTQRKRTPSRQTLSSAVWGALRDAWEDLVKWNQNKLSDLLFIHVWKHCFPAPGRTICVCVCAVASYFWL